MKYQKRYIQKTVMAADPEAFDREINAIYQQATSAGQTPEVHYFDSLGLCASVRFYAQVEIPETAKDRYQLKGIQHTCADCPHFRPSFDGRVKWTSCEVGGCLSSRENLACEAYYEDLERREEDGARND